MHDLLFLDMTSKQDSKSHKDEIHASHNEDEKTSVVKKSQSNKEPDVKQKLAKENEELKDQLV